MNETKYEVNSIKNQILKTDLLHKKSFKQLQENKVESLALKEKVKAIERQLYENSVLISHPNFSK